MIDTNKINLNSNLVRDLVNQLGWDAEKDGAFHQAPLTEALPYLKQITAMSAREAFRHVCIENGIIGYADSLYNVMETLQKAETVR